MRTMSKDKKEKKIAKKKKNQGEMKKRRGGEGKGTTKQRDHHECAV